MTQPQAPYKTTPQVNALRSLQDVFTIEQIQEIADQCKELLESGGWGEIMIRFDNGKPDLIGITTTKKMTRKP